MNTIAHTTESAPEDEFVDERVADPGEGSTTRDGLALISRFVKVQPRSFVLSLIGGIGWSLLVVGATYVLGRVTDQVITPAFDIGVGGSTVLWAMFALCVVAVLRGASVAIRRWYGSVTETVNQAELRRAVSHHLLVMPFASYRRHQTGQLLANADVDITTATRLLMPLPFSIGVVSLAAFSLISLLMADPFFALVALVLFPLLALLSRYYTNRVSGPAALVQERLGVVSSIAHESFDGALTVKTLGRQSHETERFAVAADRVRTERLVVARLTSYFEPLIQMLPNLGMIVLLLVGAWRVDSGASTPGELVQAVALFGWLAFPMRIVGFMFESLPMSVVSARRVDKVLAEPESPSAEGIAGTNLGAAVGAGRKLRGRGLDLVVEDLSFSYDENSEPVLDSVSFDVQPGEVVALVGPTGSGKTTLMNLLVRLDEPDDGTITLGGVGIGNVDPDELRDAVSIAFQEGFLFASSIRDNVSMGRDLGAAGVTDSLDRAEANRFVSRLPDGVDTVVGERGVTLSGGQRQRVALARALARKPKVLLLDDATSAVDPVIEAQILARLRDGATTMLIVAHRLSTILLADRVVFLDEGRVRAQGTHAELLGNPDYAALVQAYEEPGEGEPADGDEPTGIEEADA